MIDIETRRKKVLGLLINTYIKSGEPVSSRAIWTQYSLGLCSASIRNVMADLEEIGLITHLHTSAGRIPTDKGYRYYVDKLLEHIGLTPQEEIGINKEYIARQLALEELIGKTSKVLSDFTHYAGVVSLPIMKRSFLKRIQFTLLGQKKICVILITNAGVVRSSVLQLDSDIDATRLERIEKFLNSQLEATPLSQVKSKLRRMMIQERHTFFFILKQAVELIDLSLLVDEKINLFFEGLSNILEFPEFKNSEKAYSFIKALDEKKTLMELIQEVIDEDLDENKVKVLIGQENPRGFMNEFSVVLGDYKIDNQIVGALGVIGPKRMNYGKVIATVRYVSKVLSEMLTQFSI